MAYSWSTFPTEEHPREWIRPGDSVSASDFDSEEEYDELVAVGAIRDAEYPIPKDDDGNFVFDGSPREYALAQLAAMSENADELVASVVMNTKVAPAQEEAAAAALEAAPPDDGSKSAPKAATAGNAKDK
jgi:hypothetical protein